MEFLCRFLIEWNTATSQQQVLTTSVDDEISVKIILMLSLRENVPIKKKNRNSVSFPWGKQTLTKAKIKIALYL